MRFIKSVFGRGFDSLHLHNSAPLDKRLSRLPFTEEIRGSKPLRSTLYREIVAAVARQAHNLEVGGSIPSLATR